MQEYRHGLAAGITSMKFEQVRAEAGAKFSSFNDKAHIKISIGSSRNDSAGTLVFNGLQKEIDKSGIPAKIVKTGSFGYYDLEPILIVEKTGRPAVLFNNATSDAALEILNDALTNDIPHISSLPLFNLQSRIALRNCGFVDPEDINHYIVRGQGFAGLSQALRMNPQDLMGVLIRTALRGRGCVGDSTPDGWRRCHEVEGHDKYLICNAVDADPRSLTARLLLESDPHSVLEGMLVSAYAVGASHCILYLRPEHALTNRLARALEQMREYSLLGNNILGSDFCSEIEIQEVPAPLTSGDTAAILYCLNEKQPLPYVHPTYPALSKYADKSVLIHNAEIMSSVSAFFHEGKGAKVVTLSGSAVHRYTVEVALGTTIRNIVEIIGGGASNGKAIKAVQAGGPAGAFWAPDALDFPVGCDADEESYSNIGSGTIEVFDTDSSIVALTKGIMASIQTQSCGKCLFCREGSLQMSAILEEISDNRGKRQDLDLLIELGEAMKVGSLCSFGRAAPDPVLSSIRLFRNEYEKRLKV